MKEEKIREKYPNIKTEEDFEKLCKMLKYRKNHIIAVLCAGALFLLGGILYTVNHIITIAGLLAGFVVWIIGVARWGRYVDEFFLATARRKKVENRVLLNKEIVQKTLQKSVIKELGSDLVASMLIGLLCMIIWGLCLTILDEADREVPVLIFFGIIPLIAFGILRIGAIIKRRNTKNTPYVFLQTKILSRKAVDSSDPESSSESYYFTFKCAEYGQLDYEVGRNRYHAAFIGEDKYYLVVVKKRFSKNHRIAAIFSAEEYELSPELENIVRVI